MVHSRSLALIGLAVASPVATNGFALVTPSIASSRPSSSLAASRDPINERDAIRNIAAVSMLSLGLLFPSTDAFAAQDTISQLPFNDHALQSSTVQLSKEIKTMDFSMPSSYDSISAPVASGTDELVNTSVVNTTPSRKKKVVADGPSPKEQAAAKRADQVAERKANAVSPKEQAAAARADRVAEREAKEAEQAARDEQSAKERDENIKAARAEKIAKRAAAQAEKDAAATEKEDAKFKDAKFVDTSMPTY